MKKFTAILLSFLFVLSFAACGSSTNDETTVSDQNIEAEAVSNDTTEQTSESETKSDSKVLVVYYSATGSTKTVGDYIADALNADVFELKPVKEYTSADLNWTDDNSRVVSEHNDADNRYVELTEKTVSDWNSYDIVFVGYPIWWGIAAWPVDEFIKSNDFTDKTVIPFCTSASSGLGESGKLLAEMAGTGNWIDGQRFSSVADEATVIDWVNNLEIGR
ncbi:MAG: flavodoxin [Faecalibacterium sp.]|nr:flavodoxin [Ruminococcus sp.]MCM1392976.1 flavodoxin [Ruminococcus sp.]MCM1484670.1 flavodoxin [Faecalibacterium sp.]